jgi:broad specificity phosphatase PhoE
MPRVRPAAAALGDAFRRIGVPVGKAYTSRFNRAYETAILAGFKQAEKISELTDAGPGMLPAENAAHTEAFRKLLGTAPQPGTNTVLVTHKPNIVDALGKDWAEVKEGEASIFRPANGNYTLVARVQMDDWSRIAAAK